MAAIAPDLVSDSYIEIFEIPNERKVHGKSFPLGVKVKDGAPFKGLNDAITHIESLADRGTFNTLLRRHGAILFRGFPIKTAEDFSSFTKVFKYPRPHQEVGLSGKRTTVGDNIKTANEEPPNIKFYYHNEYGRSAHFPGILFFYSQQVPEQGKRHQGITGRQYYPSKEDPESKTVGWNWQDSYGFDILPEDSLETKRRKVEHVLKTRLQADAEWQENGAVHVVQSLPAFRRIASTNQVVPFNGLGGVYGRQRDKKALEPPHKGTDGNYHLPTTYGDGSPIPRKYLERLLEISDEIGFLVPWVEGDVALVDNYTVQKTDSYMLIL
ncbi:unnamed protein product [Clonostachys solani]|uniref:TauD/TfdA-like domain-containing protein n=1 Tax=Clonostachys solani TaxID=160281 RepID=A0A9P0ESE6_9HYPO|nr:unnamed protein product [Clonostachys solani]